MKIRQVYSSSLILFILVISYIKGTSQKLTFILDDGTNSFVMIQLREQSSKEDSSEASNAVKVVVDQIKLINAKLGYEQFDIKVASFKLENKGRLPPYLTIRNFDEFKTAEAYSKDITMEIPTNIYGQIKMPFPISNSNYKSCVAGKDFKSYYKFYSKSRQKA